MSAGAVGGASNDAGVEYQRSVAAYAVVYGLAGEPLVGFGVPRGQAVVTSVAAETDHAVDDIAVECGTWRVHVQARRRLERGRSFESAVDQWVEAARNGLDPDRHRLVLVANSVSGPIGDVRKLLERLRTDRPGQLTKDEQRARTYLDSLLSRLTAEDRDAVYACAHIHVLELDGDVATGVREATHLLGHVVPHDDAANAWHTLVRRAGGVTRLRGGYETDRWLELLLEDGHDIEADGRTTVTALARRLEALAAYRRRAEQRGSEIDLRPLGATIPPIPVDDLGMHPHVIVPDADDRTSRPLIWAVLRRGRVVLRGLPGGGKSTALEVLAAELYRYASDVMPLLVSLKEVDDADRTRGFRDRLLDTAVRDAVGDERELVRAELDRRLATGRLVLLLDSLDETRTRRGQVVKDLDRFLREISDDVGVVLATRDVAYAQAATLGWSDLRLASPDDVERAIERVLQQASPGDDSTWVPERLRWVKEVIERDRTLKETPLLPVLLALLAAERNEASLPEHRATILHAVVESVVQREVSHGERLELDALDEVSSVAAALDGFASIATQIAMDGGRSSITRVRHAVAAILRNEWAVNSRRADAAAESIVHFWDEAGFFVISGADESVRPRLELFAEVGEARRAVAQPDDEIIRWTVTAADAGRHESLVLAAGLSGVAADSLVTLAVERGSRELLHTAVTAVRQGADLTTDSIQRLGRGLSIDAQRGDKQGWRSFSELVELPLGDGDIELALAALEPFPDEHKVVGKTAIMLRSPASTDGTGRVTSSWRSCE